MKVGRHEITEGQIADATNWMKSVSSFDVSMLVNALNHYRVHPFASYRAADRLIQRERKAGNIIKVRHAVWKWKASAVVQEDKEGE